jgi:hypothetical protein
MFVVRDQDNQLFLYSSKPWRYSDGSYKWANAWNSNDPAIPIDETLFPDLKWESEPLEVELKAAKPKLYCYSCGEELKGQDLEGPRHDEDGNVLCDDCYYEEYCFECCMCGDYAINKEKQTVIIFDETFGVKPGLYQILKRPFYYCPVAGEGAGVFNDALQRIGDIPDGVTGDGYMAGYLCADCQRKVMK